MKIVIVGAGISGLSTYLSLKKHVAPLFADSSAPLEIQIYESHLPRAADAPIDSNAVDLNDLSASTALVGGGLGVGPNGMRVLRGISEGVYQRLRDEGFVVKNFAFKSAYGWRLMSMDISASGGDDEHEQPERLVSCSRHLLWQVLKDEAGEGAVKYRKVVGVVPGDSEGRKAVVKFDGGDEEEADLVIGADGIRSKVRAGIARSRGEEGDTCWAPVFMHLIGVGGFLDQQPPEDILRDESMTFVFGPQGFFGYGAASKNKTMWWSTSEATDEPDRSVILVDELKDRLRLVHRNWTDPVVRGIIDQIEVDTIYPTWTIGDLPTWSADGTVIVGDAAHALQPTSGQGSSQALEDSKTLALLLRHYIAAQLPEGGTAGLKSAVQKSCKALYDVRNPLVQKIARHANKMANKKKTMSNLEEYMMYGMMWLMGKFPLLGRLMLGNAQQEVMMWDSAAEIAKYVREHP